MDQDLKRTGSRSATSWPSTIGYNAAGSPSNEGLRCNSGTYSPALLSQPSPVSFGSIHVTAPLLETALHSWHAANQGRMVDFAGWSMPVQYSSIIEEHQATRTSAGLFDVSHMGRFEFTGDQALSFLDRLTTRRVANTAEGKIRYSLVCNEQGTILDDVLVYRAPFVNSSASCSMVVNASNREKIAAWIQAQLVDSGIQDVTFSDQTMATSMIAVQGPLANQLVAAISSVNPADLEYYTGATAEMLGATGLLSRTGYSGEDGCEIIVQADKAEPIWCDLMERGASDGVKAAGLGARDTLRLEAAMPLYGHELSESINAAQTGLGFAINVKDRDFVGKEAIVEARKNTDRPFRVGLELKGRRAAREHSAVYLGDQQVGEITSGTFSPTLEKPIAMAYVASSVKEPGTEVEVDIRGKRHEATIVTLPFYSRK